MDYQEALNSLAALKGARDALLGFDNAMALIEPLLSLAANAEADLKRMQAENASLKRENAAHEDARAQYNRNKAELEAQFEREKSVLVTHRNQLVEEIDGLKAKLSETEVETKEKMATLNEAVAAKQHEFDSLDAK